MYAPVALTGQGSQPLMPLQNSTASQCFSDDNKWFNPEHLISHKGATLPRDQQGFIMKWVPRQYSAGHLLTDL